MGLEILSVVFIVIGCIGVAGFHVATFGNDVPRWGDE